MTFAQLREKLFGTPTKPGSAFPLGTPENLIPLLNDYLVEAMIEIQRSIECWQVGHTDVFPACGTLVQNGTTVVSKPDGKIDRVYTIENAKNGWNVPIPYNPTTLQFLRRWMARFRSTSIWQMRPESQSMPTGHEGFSAPSKVLDSPGGRALIGIYAIDPRVSRLVVAPWIQSNEALIVEWTGIKRSWKDEDLVSDNADFVRLVRLWIIKEYGTTWASADLSIRVGNWRESLADQIVTCAESRHLAGEPRGEEEGDEIACYYGHNPQIEIPAPPSTEPTLAFVGDTGLGGDVAKSIAASVSDASLLVLLGDVAYPPVTLEEGLAPFQSAIDAGKVVAALGNHDLDPDAGAAVSEAVGNPGNGRYFSKTAGIVEVFVVNSGLNTDGDEIEPYGAGAGSKQWSDIRGMIARSCATWKVVVLHHPPYTSGERYVPGTELVRWVSSLEVHAVIAAHSHNYERGTWGNRPHFVVGTGGGNTGVESDGFSSPVAGSSVRISTFGFLRLKATSTEAVFEFVDLGGSVQDSVTITGDPPLAP